MPDVPGPAACRSREEHLKAWAEKHMTARRRETFLAPGLVEIKPAGFTPPPVNPEAGPSELTAWIRAKGVLPATISDADGADAHDGADEVVLDTESEISHALLLAYASDFVLLTTALRPHGVGLFDPMLEIATLTHAVHFHRPCRLDQWCLHQMSSPTASGSMGFARGSVFAADGTLVASTIQEGLIRMRTTPPSRPSYTTMV